MDRLNVEASRIMSNTSSSRLPSYSDLQVVAINQTSRISHRLATPTQEIEALPDYTQAIKLPIISLPPPYSNYNNDVSCSTDYLHDDIEQDTSVEDIIAEYIEQLNSSALSNINSSDNNTSDNNSYQQTIINEIHSLLGQPNNDVKTNLLIGVGERCFSSNNTMMAKYCYYYAAKYGNKSAKANLKGAFESSIGFFKRYKIRRKAIHQNDMQAKCDLAVIYAFGFRVNVNHTKAKKWFAAAALQGSEEAKFFYNHYQRLFLNSN